MFAQDPFIDQGELRKSVLEADDSSLVKRLLVDPQQKASDQAEDQAMELMIMKDGFPAAVSRADDHQAHVRTMLDYIALKSGQGEELDQLFMQRLQEHIQAHLAIFQEDDAKGARQLANEVKELSDAANQAAKGSMEANQSPGLPPERGMEQAGSGGAPIIPGQ